MEVVPLRGINHAQPDSSRICGDRYEGARRNAGHNKANILTCQRFKPGGTLPRRAYSICAHICPVSEIKVSVLELQVPNAR